MSSSMLPSPLRRNKSGYPWDTASIVNINKKINYPKISIITPSFNQGEFLEETIRSVLMQNYSNLEYIIIDGGSTDNSIEIIERYSDFITFWVSEPDNGQTDAINRGFNLSTGEIMGWLNSDDILLPDALNHIADTFMQNPETKIVTGLRKIIDVNSNFMYNFFHGRPLSEHIRHMCDIGQETTYWHRSLWESLGELDPNFNFAMDYDYWQRAIHAGYEFTLIPHYIGALREHSESKSSTLIDTWNKELQIIYQRYNIANNYDEAEFLYAQIDKNWPKRRRFLRDMRHSKLSNNAGLLVWLDDLLRTPIIGTFVLQLHNQYRKLRGHYHD